jgi:hypothetical protein
MAPRMAGCKKAGNMAFDCLLDGTERRISSSQLNYGGSGGDGGGDGGSSGGGGGGVYGSIILRDLGINSSSLLKPE